MLIVKKSSLKFIIVEKLRYMLSSHCTSKQDLTRLVLIGKHLLTRKQIKTEYRFYLKNEL